MAITDQKLIDLEVDINDIGDSTNKDKVISPRYGNNYMSLPMVSRKLVEMSVPNAKYYLTKEALDADLTNVENDQYAMVVNDLDLDIQPTADNGFYQKQSGAWVYLAWNPLQQFIKQIGHFGSFNAIADLNYITLFKPKIGALAVVTSETDENLNGEYVFDGTSFVLNENSLFLIKQISAPIDFLNIGRQGKFIIILNSDFNSSTNTPPVVSSTKHGIITNYQSSNYTGSYVSFYSFADAKFYVNFYNSIEWSGWTSFATLAEIQTAYTSAITTNNDSDARITPQTITSVDDFHNLATAQGSYKLSTNGVVNNGLNAPIIQNTNKHGMLGVQYIAPTDVALTYHSFADNTLQIKYNAGGVWKPWNVFKPDNWNICSNGATLRRLRAKLGNVKNVSSQLRIAIGGDSWAEQTPITQAFISLYKEKYSYLGDGWISVFPNWHIGNSIVNTNFTLYDASTASAPSVYLTGIDGNCIYTTRTDATCVVNNITGGLINIYYYDGDGTFNYSVDGGTAVTVACAGTNTFAKKVISGLSNTNQHTISINTVGNTGTVAILGFYSVVTGVGGVQFFRVGNGGLRSKTMQNFYDNVGYFASDMSLDTYINILGTNDVRNADSNKEVYKATLTQLISNYRAASGAISIILCSPAQSSQTEVNKLSDYDEVVRELSITLSVEYYSLYLQFGSYGEASALQMWQTDKIHPSQAMGYTIAHYMNADLLKL